MTPRSRRSCRRQPPLRAGTRVRSLAARPSGWLAQIALFCGLLGVLFTPAGARADDLADFERARSRYESQDFARAIALLEDLVGGAVPRVRNAALRLESRKYLGASYLFVGRDADALEQFRQLLEEDPDYALDPVSFPAGVQAVFDQARAELAAARAAAEAEQRRRVEEEERERLLRLAAEQERVRRLEELARYETVVVPNSRFLATMPFGVGQFRNGNNAFGASLAISQLTLFGAALGTYVALHGLQRTAARCAVPASDNCPLRVSQAGGSPTEDEIRFADRSRRLRASNLVLSSALGALALVGILEAHINYLPERRTRRLREGAPATPITVDLRLGPGAFSLTTHF